MIAESELWGTAVGFLALVGICALLHIWEQSKTDQKNRESSARAATERQKASSQSTHQLEKAISTAGTLTSDERESIEGELSRRARTRTTSELVTIARKDGHLGRAAKALYTKVLRERLREAVELDLETSRIDMIDDNIDDKTLQRMHKDSHDESDHWHWLVTHELLVDRKLSTSLPPKSRAVFIDTFVDERLNDLIDVRSDRP